MRVAKTKTKTSWHLLMRRSYVAKEKRLAGNGFIGVKT